MIVAMVLVGCGTPNWYSKFYQDYRPSTEEIMPLGEGVEPRIIVIDFDQNSIKEGREALLRKGYVQIGHSAFWAANATEEQLKKHAKEIGAEVVLHSSKYLRTRSGVATITQYNPGQTYNSSFSGNFGGNNFYGNSTTTSQGSYSNQYVPYSVDTYEFAAGYFKRNKNPFTFGVFLRELNSAEKSELQSNKGVVIDIVVDGTPAYRADLLKDDVIVSIDGNQISDFNSFGEAVKGFGGRKMPVTVIRMGQRKTIQVILD